VNYRDIVNVPRNISAPLEDLKPRAAQLALRALRAGEDRFLSLLNARMASRAGKKPTREAPVI